MSGTPSISGIHHVTLAVSDLDRSVAWYSEVLGFSEIRRLEVGGLQKALLVRDGLLVTFVDHGDLAEPGAFNERRCGLDHLSFAVPDRPTLEDWALRLDTFNVRRGEVTPATVGDMVAFRDPDNIALEFYTRQ